MRLFSYSSINMYYKLVTIYFKRYKKLEILYQLLYNDKNKFAYILVKIYIKGEKNG